MKKISVFQTDNTKLESCISNHLINVSLKTISLLIYGKTLEILLQLLWGQRWGPQNNRKTFHRSLCWQSPACWFSTKPSTEFLSVKGTIYCLPETKGSAQEISQIGPDGHWFKFRSPQPPLALALQKHPNCIFTYQVITLGVRYKGFAITYIPYPQWYLIWESSYVPVAERKIPLTCYSDPETCHEVPLTMIKNIHAKNLKHSC